MYGIDLLLRYFSSDPEIRLIQILELIFYGPILLWSVCYFSYFFWQTVQNAILALRDKPVHKFIYPNEFWPFNLIQRARRKQAIEKENEKENEQEKNRASVCDMINSRTEIVSSTFERYGLILSSIRVHPYGEKKYACDLTVESREGTELTDNVYIHVLLFDDNDYEMDRLDIRIRSKRFSGYLVKNNEDFSINRDTVPTHMKVYVDKNW